jgi:hypothetical protein
MQPPTRQDHLPARQQPPAQPPAVREPEPSNMPVPIAMANRWNDLLEVHPEPAGPGTNTWTLHDDTTELPIFREIEAGWFKAKGDKPEPARPRAATATMAPPKQAPSYVGPSELDADTATTETRLPPRIPTPRPEPTQQPAPTPEPAQVSVPVGASGNGNGNGNGNPGSNGDGGDAERAWRTRADDGWAAARAAALPQAAGTTRSGLPKRAPQAQLVPGGVVTEQAARVKRTPDEVRGLLSSYHRGVRRGRAATGADEAKTEGGMPPMSKGNN